MTTIYSCDCASYEELPDIDIGLATDDRRDKSKWFTLPKESYMSKNENGSCKQMLLTPSNEKFGKGASSDYWILGDIFLQNYYSIYDFPNGKVGLIDSRAGGVKDNSEPKETKQSMEQVSDAWSKIYSSMTEDTTDA